MKSLESSPPITPRWCHKVRNPPSHLGSLVPGYVGVNNNNKIRQKHQQFDQRRHFPIRLVLLFWLLQTVTPNRLRTHQKTRWAIPPPMATSRAMSGISGNKCTLNQLYPWPAINVHSQWSFVCPSVFWYLANRKLQSGCREAKLGLTPQLCKLPCKDLHVARVPLFKYTIANKRTNEWTNWLCKGNGS